MRVIFGVLLCHIECPLSALPPCCAGVLLCLLCDVVPVCPALSRFLAKAETRLPNPSLGVPRKIVQVSGDVHRQTFVGW